VIENWIGAEDCRLHFNELGFDFFKVDYCGGLQKHLEECASDKVRTMYLSIDGGAPVKLKVADTAGKFVPLQCEVDFSAGVHEIRLFNPWSKIPVIDRMIIN